MKETPFEKDKRKGNLPPDAQSYAHVRELMGQKLNALYGVSLPPPATGQDVVLLNTGLRFGFEAAPTAILVFHPFGHHHCCGMLYQSVEDWAEEAVSLLALFINRAVRLERYYRGRTLVKTRLVSLADGEETDIEAPYHTVNPFKLFSSAPFRVETDTLEFPLDGELLSL